MYFKHIYIYIIYLFIHSVSLFKYIHIFFIYIQFKDDVEGAINGMQYQVFCSPHPNKLLIEKGVEPRSAEADDVTCLPRC